METHVINIICFTYIVIYIVSLLLMMQIALIRKWKVHQLRVDHHTQSLKNTLFNWTVIDLVMRIQPFKSNEHLRADDPCTKQNTIFSIFFLFIFACSNASLFIKFKIFHLWIRKKLMNLLILSWLDFQAHKKILPEVDPRIWVF